MRVLLDGVPLNVQTPSLAEALAAARAHAESAGRIVIDAQLDQRPIADEILASPPTLPTDGELACLTADPGELVHDALMGVAELLLETKADHRAAAELLSAGKLEDALTRLPAALRTWETVRQSVGDAAAILGLSPESPPLAGPVGELAGGLAEVKRCFSAKDWAGLSDAVGEDLILQADRWRVMVLDLAEHARANRGANRYAVHPTAHPTQPAAAES